MREKLGSKEVIPSGSLRLTLLPSVTLFVTEKAHFIPLAAGVTMLLYAAAVVIMVRISFSFSVLRIVGNEVTLR